MTLNSKLSAKNSGSGSCSFLQLAIILGMPQVNFHEVTLINALRPNCRQFRYQRLKGRLIERHFPCSGALPGSVNQLHF